MTIYRFYFVDETNQILGAEEHKFAHDKEAIDNGAAIYAHHGECAMEIWLGTRLVQRQKIDEIHRFERLNVGDEVRFVVHPGEERGAPQASSVIPVDKHHPMLVGS